MKRIITILTVTALMVAMVALSAVPAMALDDDTGLVGEPIETYILF